MLFLPGGYPECEFIFGSRGRIVNHKTGSLKSIFFMGTATYGNVGRGLTRMCLRSGVIYGIEGYRSAVGKRMLSHCLLTIVDGWMDGWMIAGHSK